MLTVDALKKFGADVESGLARCMNNESFYFRLIGMAVKEPSVISLGEALKAGDLDKAFEEAHKLKGAMGNLSLTPIFVPVSELCELLRNKTPGDYETLYAEILGKTNELTEIIG